MSEVRHLNALACILGTTAIFLALSPRSASADRGAVAAAEHELTRSSGQLVAETVWVMRTAVHAGEEVIFAAPLPVGSTLEVHGSEQTLEPQRDTMGRIESVRFVAVTARGDRVRLRTTTPMDSLPADHLPIAAPRSTRVHRVAVRPPLRFEANEASRLRTATGIRVDRAIHRDVRRAADRHLDGELSHRQLGALYLTPAASGLPGRIETSSGRPALMFVTAGIFVLSALILWGAFVRARRTVEVEKAEAYLAAQLPPKEAELVGIRGRTPLHDTSGAPSPEAGRA